MYETGGSVRERAVKGHHHYNWMGDCTGITEMGHYTMGTRILWAGGAMRELHFRLCFIHIEFDGL